MNMKFAAVAALGALSIAAFAPQAAAADNGFYIGAGITQSNFDIDLEADGEEVSGDAPWRLYRARASAVYVLEDEHDRRVAVQLAR